MKTTKGLALATAALMLAGGLAACNKDNGGANGTTGDKTSTTAGASKDADKGDGDKGEVKGDDKAAAAKVASDFYNTMFSDPLPGGMETFQKLSKEMADAVGDTNKEVFSSANPREAIAKLPQDKQDALLAAVEKYGNVKDLVNYDQLSTPDKVLTNMVSVMFRLVSASGVDGAKVSFTVDQALLKKEGGEILVPANAFTAKSGDKSSNEVVPGNLYVTKTGDGWRVDGAKLVDVMMSDAHPDAAGAGAAGAGASGKADDSALLGDGETGAAATATTTATTTKTAEDGASK